MALCFAVLAAIQNGKPPSLSDGPMAKIKVNMKFDSRRVSPLLSGGPFSDKQMEPENFYPPSKREYDMRMTWPNLRIKAVVSTAASLACEQLQRAKDRLSSIAQYLRHTTKSTGMDVPQAISGFVFKNPMWGEFSRSLFVFYRLLKSHQK